MLITFWYAETEHWVLSESLSTDRATVEAFCRKENYERAEIKSFELPLETLLLKMLKLEKNEQVAFAAAGIKVMKLKH